MSTEDKAIPWGPEEPNPTWEHWNRADILKWAGNRGPGKASQRSPAPYDIFELWLKRQTDRQDRGGAVARWILADLERGCWPASGWIELDGWWVTGEQRCWEEWARHLLGIHDWSVVHWEAFLHLYREFCKEETEMAIRTTEELLGPFIDRSAERDPGQFEV